MAYRELVKNFEKIRAYMRDFYVYGFKTRNDFNKKSLRSYDDERRRIESYLGDYMKFNNSADGKRVFLSIDSRETSHNPLYKAWKAKSFTDGDITLHFILFDILCSMDVCMTVRELTERIDEYLSVFESPMTFDESTVRKKLKEYEKTGLVRSEKRERKTYYRAERRVDVSHLGDVLDFFSETAPIGVTGSFLLDKTRQKKGKFSFKHHYITGAMDSEVLCRLLCAMQEKRYVSLASFSPRNREKQLHKVVPLRILESTQSGRCYLTAYSVKRVKIESFRLDYLSDIELLEVCDRFDELREILSKMQKYAWGASMGDGKGTTYHTEFTVKVEKDEGYIARRLEREKRTGRVERLDESHYRFSAEVLDEYDLVPWIRTFICRITDIKFTDKKLQKQFEGDIEEMYSLYSIGGEG